MSSATVTVDLQKLRESMLGTRRERRRIREAQELVEAVCAAAIAEFGQQEHRRSGDERGLRRQHSQHDVHVPAPLVEVERAVRADEESRCRLLRVEELLVSVSEVVNELADLIVHGSPSVGDSTAGTVEVVEPIVGAASGVASFGAPDATSDEVAS